MLSGMGSFLRGAGDKPYGSLHFTFGTTLGKYLKSQKSFIIPEYSQISK